MAAEIDEALCIRHWEWSETSQTVVLFTRGHGVVRGLAKGSRRPRAAFSGGIELLTVGEVGIIARPQSELALLTYWDLKRTYPPLRTSLVAHRAGMYMADMIQQFVRDHDAHPGLYDRTLRALDQMSDPREEAVPAALLDFQWALLEEAGFRPHLEHDAVSGEELARSEEYLFSAQQGGLVSAEAGGGGGGAPDGWRVRRETVDLLRAVSSPAPDASRGAAGRAGAVPGSLDRANRLLASYARHLLGHEPSTMRVVFGDRLAR